MTIDLVLIYAAITILSLILLMATLFSFLHFKNRKLLFVSMIFFVLLLRGSLLSLSIFDEQFDTIVSSGYIWIFDVIILMFLYAAYSTKR